MLDIDTLPGKEEKLVTFHGEEQRLVYRVLGHWRRLAGHRAMPRLEEFDPWAIPEMWDDCFVIDASDPSDLAFHSVGASHIAVLGRNPSGQRLSSVGPNTLLAHAVAYAGKVVERRVPISLGGQFIDGGRRMVLYRSILMPLAGDRGLALLGAANCRAVVLG